MRSESARLWTLRVFAVCLGLPTIQTIHRVLPSAVLHGTEVAVARPRLSLSSVIRGDFQRDADRWFNSIIGFRGFFVKTDNQICFSLFDELPATGATSILVGKNRCLYETSYLGCYNDPTLTSQEKLGHIAAELAELQDDLLRRHVQFLLLISPSKAATYPELIPQRHLRRAAADQDQSAYKRFMPLVTRFGINVLDGVALTREAKERGSYPVFPRCGAHWSSYSAAVVAERLSSRLEPMLGKPLVPLRLAPPTLESKPRQLDGDLASLANLWFPETTYELFWYPPSPGQQDVENRARFYRPNVLFIGDSFSWPVLHYYDDYQWYSKRDFYYYFKTNYRYPHDAPAGIDAVRMDWDAEIFSRDAVIIEINEAILGQTGFGFLPTYLRKLRK